MKLLKLLTIFLLINLLGGCAKDIENLSGDIFGKVTDTSTGEPLKSATVLLTPGGKSVTTGEHGTFEFKALTAGQYELQIKKEGYETNTKQIVVTSGSVAAGDMALAPVKKVSKVEISANVLDFGTTHSSLTFDIKNIGNTGEIDWTISGVDVDWISVTPITGTTDAGKSSVVKVVLDRTKVIDNHSTNIIVNADGESFPVTITAKHIEASTKVKLSTDKLDFGTAFSSLTFEIENITVEEDIDWTITGIDVNWFTVSTMQGSTNAGKNSVVKVELDRTKLLESKSTSFIVKADGYSFIMTVSASPMEESTKIKLSTNKLDFGKTYNSLTFDIENIGNAGAIDWTITGIDVNWLSVNPAAGKTEMGKSNVIKVELDRSKLTETSNTNIIVNAGGESFHVAIMAEHNERVLEVFPRSLAIGKEESKSFNVKSLYGSTRYELITSDTESWLSVLHASGTIPEYDPNNQETVEDIKVLVNREGMDAGNYSSILILRSDLGDIEIPVSMTVEEKIRTLEVTPSSLELGLDDSKTLTIKSFNGATNYQLKGSGDISWVVASEPSGTILEYDPNNIETVKSIVISANRKGLPAGDYECTLIIRSDLGDYEVPLSMTVEESGAGNVTNGLLAYYTFENNLNNIIDDQLNARAVGDISYVNNSTNNTKSVKFNKINNGYLNIGDALIDAKKSSISFWVNELSEGHIFHVKKATSNYQHSKAFSLSVDAGKLKFVTRSRTNWYDYDDAPAFEHASLNDGWHMITITSNFNETKKNSITTKLYIDGEYWSTTSEYCSDYDESKNDDQSNYGQGISFQLGGNMDYNGTEKLGGISMDIDNLRVYDTRELSAAEIKEIYEYEK